MPRVMTSAMATALCAPVLRAALLCSMQFGDNVVNVWSGLTPMTWTGMTFQGVGTLGAISTISEDSTVEAKGISISLSGIPSAMMTEVLYETRVLGVVSIWLCLFDDTATLIADPIMAYQGAMDEPSMDDDNQTCTMSIAVENILVDLNRPCFRRYTGDDQQMDLAATLTRLGLPSNTADTGFRFVPQIQEIVTFWGRMPSSINNV